MAPRKLKAQASSDKPVAVRNLPCVSGHWLKEPRVLPIVITENCGDAVPLTCTSSWLHEMLCGKKSDGNARETLTTMLSDVKTCLTAVAGNAGAANAGAAVANVLEQRDVLGLSEDEEEDEDSQPPRKLRRKTCFVWREVVVKGCSIIVAFHRKQYYVQHENGGANLGQFLDALFKYQAEEVRDRVEKKKRCVAASRFPAGSFETSREMDPGSRDVRDLVPRRRRHP